MGTFFRFHFVMCRQVSCFFMLLFGRSLQVGAAESDGREISIESAIGTTLQAYAAGPLNAKKGVLILHDLWGLNATVRGWTERFAAQGYRALAIDLFDGRISKDLGLANEIMNSIDPEWVKADIQAGLDYLQTPGRKLAVVGWGYGGGQSYQAALIAPERISATVVGYGLIETNVEQVRSLKAPVFAIFAEADQKMTLAKVAHYEALMKKSLVRPRTLVFDGDHGFIDPNHTTYDAKLAEEAWQQVDWFLAALMD